MIPHNKYRWTIDEDNFLKRNFFALTNAQLAEKLGLKPTSVRHRCYDLGMKKMFMEYWTPAQVTFLKENYQSIGDTELAQIFSKKWAKKKGWTKKHIEKKRRYLKLKRTEAQKNKIHRRNVENGFYAMCAEKAWKNRRIPEGTVKVWKDSDNHRAYIKTKNGFKPYASWLWKNEVGKVPKGMVVRIIKNAPVPKSVEDLELITRAENARRNGAEFHALPEDLKKVIKLTHKIQKQL